MLAWDAPAHIEPRSDPLLTATISFGNDSGQLKLGAEPGFAFPAVNGPKGLALESGSGTAFLFSAKTYRHGTAFSAAAAASNTATPKASNIAGIDDLLAAGLVISDSNLPAGSSLQHQAGPNPAPTHGNLTLPGRPTTDDSRLKARVMSSVVLSTLADRDPRRPSQTC